VSILLNYRAGNLIKFPTSQSSSSSPPILSPLLPLSLSLSLSLLLLANEDEGVVAVSSFSSPVAVVACFFFLPPLLLSY
jgi:hypothetical protein